MSHRGRVPARDGAGDWQLLDVYDDGWCATPAPARTPEETRRRLRAVLVPLGVLVLLFGAAAATAVLLPDVPAVSYALLAASVAVAGALGVRAARGRDRPPPFGSAADQAAAGGASRRVALADVRTVAVERAGHEDVVTVTVRRGPALVYRSPDRALSRVFRAWAPRPPGR